MKAWRTARGARRRGRRRHGGGDGEQRAAAYRGAAAGMATWHETAKPAIINGKVINASAAAAGGEKHGEKHQAA